jgi:YD repeat-containing protein
MKTSAKITLQRYPEASLVSKIALTFTVVSMSFFLHRAAYAQQCPSDDRSFNCASPVSPPCPAATGQRYADCAGNLIVTATFADLISYHNAVGATTDYGFGIGWGPITSRVDPDGPTLITQDGFRNAFRNGRSDFWSSGDLRTLSPLPNGGFRLVEPDGTYRDFTHQHDGEYFPTAVVDPNGNRTELTYSSGAIPDRIIVPGMGTTTLEKTSNGRVTRVTDPAGLTYTLLYIGSGRSTALQTITGPDARSVKFVYDSSNRWIKEQIGIFGHSSKFSYTWRADGSGPALTGVTTSSNRVRNTYSATKVSHWNNGRLSETVYAFVNPRDIESMYVAQSFSGRGANNELPVVDYINLYEGATSISGRLASTTTASGTVSYFYGRRADCRSSSAPDDSPHPTCVTARTGRTTYARDSANLFRPTSVTEIAPTGALISRTTYRWDRANLVSSTITNNQRQTTATQTFTYAPGQNSPSEVSQTATTSLTWDALKGLLQSSTSPSGSTTTFTYGSFGILKTIEANGLKAEVSTATLANGKTTTNVAIPLLSASIRDESDFSGGTTLSQVEYINPQQQSGFLGIDSTTYTSSQNAQYGPNTRFSSLNVIMQKTTGLAPFAGSSYDGFAPTTSGGSETRENRFCHCDSACPETSQLGSTENTESCAGCGGQREFPKDVCEDTSSSSSSSAASSSPAGSSRGNSPGSTPSSWSSSSTWSSSSSSSSSSPSSSSMSSSSGGSISSANSTSSVGGQPPGPVPPSSGASSNTNSSSGNSASRSSAGSVGSASSSGSQGPLPPQPSPSAGSSANASSSSTPDGGSESSEPLSESSQSSARSESMGSSGSSAGASQATSSQAMSEEFKSLN